jgi:hypothetical protein
VPDELNELRRQRELQREHLEWLDREIAAREGMLRDDADAGPREPRPQAQGPSAEQILDEFRQPPGAIHRRTKLGCIAYFAVFLALLALAAAALYLHERASRAGH